MARKEIKVLVRRISIIPQASGLINKRVCSAKITQINLK
jgi:hypothetical protein